MLQGGTTTITYCLQYVKPSYIDVLESNMLSHWLSTALYLRPPKYHLGIVIILISSPYNSNKKIVPGVMIVWKTSHDGQNMKGNLRHVDMHTFETTSNDYPFLPSPTPTAITTAIPLFTTHSSLLLSSLLAVPSFLLWLKSPRS